MHQFVFDGKNRSIELSDRVVELKVVELPLESFVSEEITNKADKIVSRTNYIGKPVYQEFMRLYKKYIREQAFENNFQYKKAV